MVSGLFAFLRYLRLKLLISLPRLVIKLFGFGLQPRPDSVLWIPSRDKHRAIKAHVYLPSTEGNRGKSQHPTLINFYGSGFALPLHGLDDNFCRQVATTTNHVVLDVDYRLGPENPFPASVHDVEDAMKYVLARPEEYSASQLSVSGFSAGGTLALVAPTLFPPGTVRSVTAFYPATDLASDPSLRKSPAAGAKPRSTFWTKIFRRAYIGDMDPRDPRISPAYADVSSYPADMLIVTGELDSSALEAEELAEKAKVEGQADGRNVVIKRMEGCGHAFDKRAKDEYLVKAKDEAYKLATDMLEKIAKESD
ncbi:putative carboxylesterase [Xylogone sp. PMI_703]|nr:putative carboxylesterase [Xylogone sp. PMI_703]